MSLRARIIAACAILAAFAAGPSFADSRSAALTSFGAPLSANDLAALAIHAPGTNQETRLQPASFATSQALTTTLALDSGYRTDIGSRFAAFDQAAGPLRDEGSFLALADGGRYAGLSFVPDAGFHFRLGFSNWTGRLDNVSMDGAAIGLPNLYDTSHVDSVLAGVAWNVNDWVGLGFNAIASDRGGVPLGYTMPASLAPSAATQAVQVSARLNLGGNWITTANFGEGLTQLRLRGGATSLDAQTYAITVAKRGVFGDDAMGFSLSRPALGSIGGFNSLASSAGDLPPMMLAAAGRAPETDFQLGYVTSFLGGKLALQTNAAYQVNPQGQTGATAVSVLSRAKIKF